jgi:hypothetical protein
MKPPALFLRLLLSILLLTIPSTSQAFTLTGRQYDAFCLPSERAAITQVYTTWLAQWQMTPGGHETPSTMLHLMLGYSRGLGLTPGQLIEIHDIDTLILRRANLILSALRHSRRH